MRAAQTEIAVLAKDVDRLHPGQVTEMLVTDGAIIHEPETARTMPMLIGTSILVLRARSARNADLKNGCPE